MFARLFHRLSTAYPLKNAEVPETLRTLTETRIDRLESDFVNLRSEWAETYEKVMHLHDRNRKRDRAAEKAAEQTNDTERIAQPMSSSEQRDAVLRAFRNENGRF